jgi:hypothetical protein
MAYAGEQYQGGVYGTGGSYAGNAANATTPAPTNGMSTERAAAAIVLGSLAALIMIRRGFRGVSVSKMSGGLVRG